MTVNGRVVRVLGSKAEPTDDIAVDGDRLLVPKHWRYVVLHKPLGCVTTRSDPNGRPTVFDCLFEHDAVLHPVGRLDWDTSGLLLLTNDGELTQRLTHPKYAIEREYRATVSPRPTRKTIGQLLRGVELDDGLARAVAAKLIDDRTLDLTMTEGRNREVRRLLARCGHDVVGLLRLRYGPLYLGSLKPGKARGLRPEEVQRVRAAVGLTDVVEAPRVIGRPPADL